MRWGVTGGREGSGWTTLKEASGCRQSEGRGDGVKRPRDGLLPWEAGWLMRTTQSRAVEAGLRPVNLVLEVPSLMCL